MNALDRSVIPSLQRYLEGLRRSNPIFYRQIIERKKASTVIFFAIEAGVASYTADSFVAKEATAAGKIVVTRGERNSCPGKTCPSGQSIWMDGEHEAITEYLSQHGNAPDGTGEDFVRRMILLEISAKPSTVGPPISILLLDASGAKWIQRGSCPEITISNHQDPHKKANN